MRVEMSKRGQRVAGEPVQLSPLEEEDDEEDALVKSQNSPRAGRYARAGGCCVALTLAVGLLMHGMLREASDSNTLQATTWNIAAINNNPFEYWITHSDPDYNSLMDSVQEFIDVPGARDIAVSEVFTPARWEELKLRMVTAGWPGIKTVDRMWVDDFSQRKIISGFMKDGTLGEKRLASMPDRITNTINLAAPTRKNPDGVAYRPTVINCFDGDLGSLSKWWGAWLEFMFETPIKLVGETPPMTPSKMLQMIKHSKYPAITAEEQNVSIPLQTLAQAIFDAILIHIVNSVSPTGKWQTLRSQMCNALNKGKDVRTLAILSKTYSASDIIFIQEAASATLNKARVAAPGQYSSLADRYVLAHAASLDAKRDQNSFIFLKRERFIESSIVEHTNTVMGMFSKSVPVARGDLFVISVDDIVGRKHLLASFHGDTNGLATLPVLSAVHTFAQTMPDHTLMFGLDANTYERGSASKQDVLAFGRELVNKGYTSCWGDVPNPKNHTTFNARTFLQAQLQKAARASEKISKGDKNPKDFIVFPKAAYHVTGTTKDNTGTGKYVEDMVFPTLQFPSDHGILTTRLKLA